MKTEILTLLREHKEYLSGQELCERFGVSRTAVWKVINQLKEEGYEIESVSRKGYRLLSSPDILTASELQSRIGTEWAGKKVRYYDLVDSTNTEAKRLAENGEKTGTLVVADMQNAGRGRRGREWKQIPGTMISMSLLLRPDFDPNKASMLTVVIAHSVAAAVEETAGVEALIKWPNDIVVNKKKICGMLTEMSAELDYIHYVVVGVGINVNVLEFPEEIKDVATSLLLETGVRIPRSVLIAKVMEHFEQDYRLFEQSGDLSGIMEDYNRRLVSMNTAVKVLDPKGEYTGISKGINSTGELLVEREDGRTLQVYAGEVSVRGLYGYV